MKRLNTESIRPDSSSLHHLRLAARIAIMVSFTASLLLVIVIVLLTEDSVHSDYALAIQSLSSTHKLLGPSLVVSGLIIVTLSGVLTWIISVYSSARITGALYRFSRNLEQQINLRHLPLIAIRKKDRLHKEARHLEQAVTSLNKHYDSLLSAIEALEQTLDNEPSSTQHINRKKAIKHLKQLKKLETQVSLENA